MIEQLKLKIASWLLTTIKNKYTIQKVGSVVIYPKSTSYPVEFAFSIGNVNYYSYVNPFNVPYARAMAASAIFEEFEMRMTKDFIKYIMNGVEEKLKAHDTKGIYKLFSLCEERMAMDFELNTLYKLASVYYFDENESMLTYDVIYNAKKIESFKNEKLKSFFLQSPLRQLLPYSEVSIEEVEIRMKQSLLEQLNNTERVLEALSQTESGSDTVNYFHSQTQAYRTMLSEI